MNVPVLHQYARPTSVDGALALLGRDPSAAPIAGGTDLLPLTRARLRQVSCVVDLGRLGLNQVRVEHDELVLGALVTMSQAASDPQVLALAPLRGAPTRIARSAGGDREIISRDMPEAKRLVGAAVSILARPRADRWPGTPSGLFSADIVP